MEKQEKELLDWILRETGGSYMSDLRCGVRSHSMTGKVRRVLQSICADDWTEEQWADAALYLTDRRRTFASQSECVAWLVSSLEDT